MNKALLKQSIDEWQLLFLKARNSLLERDTKAPEPTKDLTVALTGIRRCGKTHLAFQMAKNFLPEEVLYYNFEDPLFYVDNRPENLDLLLSVAQEFRTKKVKLLILDEIQVVHAWERWLRKLIDQKRYKIIVTGSSANLLSSELASSLTGRALEHKVWPLSFLEYIRFSKHSPESQSDYLSILREFMSWGGFPEVVKAPGTRKKLILSQYFGDIVLKDILSRHQVRDKRALDQVIIYYLTNLSSLHSYHAISKAFGFDAVTASQYTGMLKDAFLVFEVFRHHQNLKGQARDAKKVYVGDLGLRAVAARSVNDDTGKLLENVVYLELLRRGMQTWYYKGKQEVDFLITEHYKPKTLFQVCASDLSDEDTYEREVSALEEAMKAYKLRSGTILSWDREEIVKVGKKRIFIVPTYRWLMEGGQ